VPCLATRPMLRCVWRASDFGCNGCKQHDCCTNGSVTITGCGGQWSPCVQLIGGAAGMLLTAPTGTGLVLHAPDMCQQARSAITCSLAATAAASLRPAAAITGHMRAISLVVWLLWSWPSNPVVPAASLLLLVMGHAEHIQMQQDGTLGAVADGQVLDTVMPTPAVQLRWKQRESRRQKQRPGAPEPTRCWKQPWCSWQCRQLRRWN
jgi:hypothetical protein